LSKLHTFKKYIDLVYFNNIQTESIAGAFFMIDVFDIALNIFRKALSDNLYTAVKKIPFVSQHHFYEPISWYRNIFKHYKEAGLDFGGKNILEVGAGKQFYTAFCFKSAGAKSVSLADPVLSGIPGTLIKSQLSAFCKSADCENNTVAENISSYRLLEDIPDSQNGTFDIICSHFVLEHFDNLEKFFGNSARLLNRGGVCYSFVDLSNHAYHIFDSKSFTRWLFNKRKLFHLGYSDSWYRAITDKRIWVNRLLVPAYESAALKADLEITYLKPIPYHKIKIHSDVINRNQTPDENKLYNSHFALMLVKK
jgi:SAM-dependent methyltransferase